MKKTIKLLSKHLLVLCALVPATSAQATFGCSILETPEGQITLFAEPSIQSDVVLMLPTGAAVSLLEQSPSNGWEHVAYSEDPKSWWGEGTRGWVLATYLDDCG